MEIYTTKTLAEFLQVSTRTIQREVSEGRLTTTKIRGSTRFTDKDVAAYIGQCTKGSVCSFARKEKKAG